MLESLKHSLWAKHAQQIEVCENEILATLSFENGRSQRIKVTLQKGKYGDYVVARCVSRACLATEPKTVRRCLMANASNSLIRFSLDTSLDPAVVDVIESVLVPADDKLDVDTLVSAIFRVGCTADRIEANELGEDYF